MIGVVDGQSRRRAAGSRSGEIEPGTLRISGTLSPRSSSKSKAKRTRLDKDQSSVVATSRTGQSSAHHDPRGETSKHTAIATGSRSNAEFHHPQHMNRVRKQYPPLDEDKDTRTTKRNSRSTTPAIAYTDVDAGGSSSYAKRQSPPITETHNPSNTKSSTSHHQQSLSRGREGDSVNSHRSRPSHRQLPYSLPPPCPSFSARAPVPAPPPRPRDPGAPSRHKHFKRSDQKSKSRSTCTAWDYLRMIEADARAAEQTRCLSTSVDASGIPNADKTDSYSRSHSRTSRHKTSQSGDHSRHQTTSRAIGPGPSVPSDRQEHSSPVDLTMLSD